MTNKSENDDFLSLFSYVEEDIRKSTRLEQNEICWLLPGDKLHIFDLVIDCGHIYFGNVDPHMYEHGTQGPVRYKAFLNQNSQAEASLIDSNLYCFDSGYKYSANDVSANTFGMMNGGQRYAYLKWLSLNNPQPTDPPVFYRLYVGGIERRIYFETSMVDGHEAIGILHSLDKIIPILSLMGQTLSGYHQSTITGTLSSCLSLARFIFHCWSDYPEMRAFADKDYIVSGVDIALRYLLYRSHKNNVGIDGKTGLLWCFGKDFYDSKKMFGEFISDIADVFYALFNEKYPNGYVINGSDFDKFNYHPECVNITIKGIVPSIPGAYSVFDNMASLRELYGIYTATINRVRPYIQYVQSNRPDKNILIEQKIVDAHVRRNKRINGFVDLFKMWADSTISFGDGYSQFSEFWALVNAEYPSKMLSIYQESIDALLVRSGYAMLPGPLSGDKYGGYDTKIAVFKFDHSCSESVKESVVRIRPMIDIFAWICESTADSSNQAVRQSHVEKIIESDLCQSGGTVDVLKNIFKLLRHCAGIKLPTKKAISDLSPDSIEKAKNYAIKIILSTGSVSPADMSLLEKIYKSFGLNRDLIASDLHDIFTSRTGLSSSASNGYTLNEDLLLQHELETKQAQNLLVSIFSESDINSIELVEDDADTAIANNEPLPISEPSKSIPSSGLTEKLELFLSEIEEKDSWSRSEIEGVCQKHGLMLYGAIESINDWSYEIAGCPLIEDDSDTINIDFDILQEIKESYAA